MECTSCYELYNEHEYMPLNLECGHTFCKTCIGDILKNCIKLECPVCRSVM